jgi:quercetin 2,3-dioxygenase
MRYAGCVKELTRRSALQVLAVAGAGACARTPEEPTRAPAPAAVRSVEPLGAPPWKTSDPFLFCVHHDDRYPRGNVDMGPAASLAGRNLGSDFAGKDGWRMYHGEVVPGFPQHPHRGFETVTVVRRGLLDHSDSLGAAARYGNGDVQWLTAGRGILHAEMFPLLREDVDNPLELFQIWLNLPAARKMVEPRFAMLWGASLPRVAPAEGVEIVVHAGALGEVVPPAPPPDSYAAEASADVAIWTVKLAASARATLPPAKPGTTRILYYFRGTDLAFDGRSVTSGNRVEVEATRELPLVNGAAESELLVLQGRPIGEPVAKHGPFVMNTQAEIAQAYEDYRRTQFGGWPWDRHDPVHGRDEARFARHADGRIDHPA